jgi:hypothetical protein
VSQGEVSTLVSLLVVALIARRELRTSTVVAGRLWIRPALVVVVTACLCALAVIEAPEHVPVLLAWMVGGIALGIATGFAILRLTTMRPAEKPNALIVKGSFATIAVWVVVLVIRVGARYLFGGTSPISNIDASVGTVAVVAAALVVVASAYHRAIDAGRVTAR